MQNKLLLFLIFLMSTSCASYGFMEPLSYQSIRNCSPSQAIDLRNPPQDAEIAIVAEVNKYGEMDVMVYNLTMETMTIDRTRSFFMESDNQIAYYDPSITTNTTTSSAAKGVNVNVGAVASILGVNSSLLNGINVGGSTSVGTATTVYNIDQPIVHIPPRGRASMGRTFNISLFGVDAMLETSQINIPEIPLDNHSFRFGVCVAYSTDQAKTFDNFISEYYVNSWLCQRAPRDNKKYYPNEALRKIYLSKPDCLLEDYYILYFGRQKSYGPEISLIDYK